MKSLHKSFSADLQPELKKAQDTQRVLSRIKFWCKNANLRLFCISCQKKPLKKSTLLAKFLSEKFCIDLKMSETMPARNLQAAEKADFFCSVYQVFLKVYLKPYFKSIWILGLGIILSIVPKGVSNLCIGNFNGPIQIISCRSLFSNYNLKPKLNSDYRTRPVKCLLQK